MDECVVVSGIRAVYGIQTVCGIPDRTGLTTYCVLVMRFRDDAEIVRIRVTVRFNISYQPVTRR